MGAMDTQMDVLAHEETRRAAVRQRSEETLAQVARTLAEPRDLEVVRRASEWQREHEQRKAQERAAEAERVARQYVPPPVRKAAPAPVDATLSRKSFRRYTDGLETALARMFGHETQRRDWRFAEAERRIADLEARLARLEGQGHG